MLQEASQLFSEHYGVWGEQAPQELGKFVQAGKSGSTDFLVFVFCPAASQVAKVATYGSARESFEPSTCPITPHALT